MDESGRIENIIVAERNVAHRLIEEFMLLANETVADFLDRRRRARAVSHSRGARPAARWSSSRSSSPASAIRSARRSNALRPRHFQKLVEKIDGQARREGPSRS